MNIIRGIEEFKAVKNPVLTVGSFDGVHLAHKALVDVLNREAERLGGESLLVTFEPHPRLVLASNDAYSERFRLLTPMEEKIRHLGKTGLQNVLFLKFDTAFAAMPYSRFISDILVGRLGVRKAVVGFNHNFGKDGEGNFEKMKQYGAKYGFEVDCFPEQLWHEQHFSSTRIRTLLCEGRVEEAAQLLGYDYRVYGRFTDGGFEVSSPFKLIPARGTYLVRVRNEKKYDFTLCRVTDTLVFPDLQVAKIPSEEMKVNFIKRLEL